MAPYKTATKAQLVEDYSLQWTEPTPLLIPDGHGGTLIVIEAVTVCFCGALATQRISYVHGGTLNPNLASLRMGASVKHYYTSCLENADHESVS